MASSSTARAEAAARPDKTYTGTVISVDPNERMLHVRGLMTDKDFNLGSSCAFALWDKPDGAAGDLRTGEKVTIRYQDAHGVLVADRIEQQMSRDEGTVKTIDPVAHTMTLHMSGADKTLVLADDCKVTLHDDKSGQPGDIQTGNHVTVIYETLDHQSIARRIAQTSATFSGTLTAIDVQKKTLKAKAAFKTRTFNVGDNCTIVLDGKMGGQLTDLKPDEKLVFSYDEINGVDVVNRIATLPAAPADKTPVEPAMSY